MQRTTIIPWLFASTAIACGSDAAFEVRTEPLPYRYATPESVAAEIDGLSFAELLEASYLHLVLRSPETITYSGLMDVIDGPNDRLDDISIGFEAETARIVEIILGELRSRDRGALSPADQISYDAFEYYLEDRLATCAQRHYYFPLTYFLTAVHRSLERFLTDSHRLLTRRDVESYVVRLFQIGDKLSEVERLVTQQEEMGIVPARIQLEWTLPGLRAVSQAAPRNISYYQALADNIGNVSELSENERRAYLDAATQAAQTVIIPAYQRLEDLTIRLLGIAPTAVGMSQYPGGAEAYAAALRHHTTTAMTAAEIHQLGLDELQRIHTEIDAQLAALRYPTGESLTESFTRVANDGGWIAADQALSFYDNLIRQAEAQLPESFDLLPGAPVEVVGIQHGGYYTRPALDGSRPGRFYASVGQDLPRFSMPSLTYHETVPGHHLQISVAQTLTLPTFRTAETQTVYTEGWALYAERLAKDLGWYEDDPHADLGRLQWEALRAVRLIVDTGLHAMNWTYDGAIQFMRENTGFAPQMLSAEGQVTRYVTWPGQACAYMVGMHRLLELRESVLQTPGFTLRDFHTMVLREGSLPLDLLETVVQEQL